MNQLDFRGRHAVVTGGATGLGLGSAQRLLAPGRTVTLVGRHGRRGHHAGRYPASGSEHT